MRGVQEMAAILLSRDIVFQYDSMLETKPSHK
jgi:hypothetical protein